MSAFQHVEHGDDDFSAGTDDILEQGVLHPELAVIDDELRIEIGEFFGLTDPTEVECASKLDDFQFQSAA